MTEETLVNIFWERVKQSPERPAILHKSAGQFRPVVWREQGRVVELLAGGLLSCAVAAGEKIAIISTTRPQWIWADLATLSAAAVTVPVYPTLGSQETEYLLRHSDSVGVFVENNTILEKLLCATELPPTLRFVVLMDGQPVVSQKRIKVIMWEELLRSGNSYLGKHHNELASRIKSIKPEDLSTIVYTSGTTGVPKGAMLLHSNIYHVCQAMSLLVGVRADDICLSFLPLSHVFERVGGEFLAIYEGLVTAYAESMETVAANMLEVRPTIIVGVPRFFEKVYHRVNCEIRKLPKTQQYLIRWALALGKRAGRYKERAHKGVSEIAQHIYRAELRVAERLVYSRMRSRFGGRLRFMVSGAAPLPREVQSFFETIGIPVLEGYGLTETAAPVTCNTPGANRQGTVGRPLPGVEIRIADDGEVLVRGPNVFCGYYKNPEATAAVMSDGWFATGDIGELDADGYLLIKDRKKDIIITAGGKHIAPQYLENLFVGDSLVSNILIYGDRRKFVSALVTLNQDGLSAFAQTNSLATHQFDELSQHPAVVAEVETVINRKNQQLSHHEQIKRFIILDHEFSLDRNELTPTLKVKRKVITEKYHDLLDSLYELEDVELERQE